MNTCLHLRRSFLFAILLAPAGLHAQADLEAVRHDRDDFADSLVHLEAFEVTGTRPKDEDATTLKLNATVQDTPRSVTVIDSSRIREQDFQVGSDLLLWVPGINTNGAVQESYHFYARGFRQTATEWRVDGFQGRIVGGSYSPSLFGIEQVSVLKGPAGLLYGSASSPGGLINLITKKPRDTAAATLDTRVRTFAGDDSSLGDRVSGEVDLDATGPVTRDGRLLYRILTNVDESALTYAGQTDRNQFYRLAFTYKLDTAGACQLTPVIEWTIEERATRSAVISPSSSRTTNDGRTDYTTDDVSPRSVNLAAGERSDTNLTTGADLTAAFSTAWKAKLSLRLHERDYENNAWTIQPTTLTQTNPADPRSWVISRRHARARTHYENLSFDASTTYEFSPVTAVRSLVQLGLNGRASDTQAYTPAVLAVDQSPINIYTGVAASPLVATVPREFPPGNLTRIHAWNAYAQSQTEFFQRAVATVGFACAREQTDTIAPGGTVSSAPARSSDLTPNVGLVWRLTRDLSLYASYSTSYSLPDATFENAQGRRGDFAPIEGGNCEMGAKAALFGDLLAASISVFDTAQNHVLVASQPTELNPNGNRYYSQLDTGRRAQGVESEFTVALAKGWQTTATYAYIDAFDRRADGSRGAPAEMTPRHAASVYSRYAFLDGPLTGLSLRLGVIWQSERWSGSAAPGTTAPDPLRLQAFHRVDAGVAYRLRQWTFAVNVENLTDEYFLLAGNTGLTMSPTNPRSVAFRTSRSW